MGSQYDNSDQELIDSVNLDFSELEGNVSDQFNTSIAKDLNENLQNFIDDLRAGIKGETGLPPSSFYTLLSLYLFVIVIGVSGNSLVLIAVFSKPTMRTAHNYFVGALASSDLFLCLFSMPITLWELLFEQWPFGANAVLLCRLFASGKVLPLFMSSMAIVAVGWDRYRCIIQSGRSPFTTKDACRICLGMATLSIVAVSPVFSIAKIDSLLHGNNFGDILVCRETWTPTVRMVYKLTTCTFQFALPVVLVVYVNFSIVMRLRSRPPSQHQNLNERRRRINNIIIAVTCVFFFSWLPLNVFQLMFELGRPTLVSLGLHGNEELVYGLLHLLGTANACFNPILYGYLNENFRNEYKSIYKKMPWYSHSQNFHRSVILLGEDDIRVVNLDTTNSALLARTTNEDKSCCNHPQEKPKREPMISRVNDVENQLPHDEGKVEDTEESPSPNPNNIEDQTAGLSDSGAFSLPECDTSSSVSSKNLFEVITFNPLKEQLGAYKNSNVYIHQKISQIVGGLEECEGKAEKIWRPTSHVSFNETYV